MCRFLISSMASKRHVLFAIVAVGLSFVATDAFAQTVTHSGAKFDGLLDLIQQNAALWNSRLQSYAIRLFWSLAVIQLVMTFFPLVLRQADFGEIAHELVKYILVIGFFYEILAHSTYWANAVIQSFRQAGGIAIGQSSALQPSGVFALAVKFANAIGQVQTWNPGVAISISLASACVLLSFTFIAAFMAVTLVEAYIVVNASVLFLGFGGSQWTREYAMAMLRYAVAVGAKLFVLTLLVGLITQSAEGWQAAYTHTDNASMWTMVGLALVCAYLTKTIPDLIQGLISGVSVGGGHAIGSMAATTLGVGAGLTAMAGGAAAGLAGGGASAGGASGGFANLLGAGMPSGGGSPGPVPSNGPNPDGMKGSALSPRVGGSGQRSASSSAGAAGAASRPRQFSGLSKGASSSIPAAHSALTVASHGLGALAAISVPGMESAPASAGGVPPMVPGGSEGEDANRTAVSPDENIILPSTAPSETQLPKE